MTMHDLFISVLFLGAAYFIWVHISITTMARSYVNNRCEKLGVHLLDQNITLRAISIKRSSHSLFSIRRIYTFEFSSVGDHRYKGKVSLIGRRIEHIEFAPFKTE